jgi:hypothetical protein
MWRSNPGWLDTQLLAAMAQGQAGNLQTARQLFRRASGELLKLQAARPGRKVPFRYWLDWISAVLLERQAAEALGLDKELQAAVQLRDTLAAASSRRAERSGAENALIEMIASPASWEGLVALLAASSGQLDVTSVVQKLTNGVDRIDLFTAALETDPDNVALLAARGECFAGQGAWALAATDYVKAAGLDPATP